MPYKYMRMMDIGGLFLLEEAFVRNSSGAFRVILFESPSSNISSNTDIGRLPSYAGGIKEITGGGYTRQTIPQGASGWGVGIFKKGVGDNGIPISAGTATATATAYALQGVKFTFSGALTSNTTITGYAVLTPGTLGNPGDDITSQVIFAETLDSSAWLKPTRNGDYITIRPIIQIINNTNYST